ncbi:hypothetical protein TGME49_239690 [Toxoplasma gondii ME49]|uniref:ER membrane protein complex subunit 6 n=4 Tax=Toxoplasma gondii TaxID=5811 RepID=B6KF77_TOXGV|nr:hypothetical protein TGME49_239690 [Toxoplasma gondii ME49]EPT30765.1 hypothetical protein TGME49_239690 [Toxoplasma gondii ME49]ESS31356.1 Rab5-interacting (Rab5ip) protein [Toxoplasma gondii VEG]KFG59680.1 Rab5-interacting (Rab5ip) protein [Toxoplasma gondii RUB]PIL95835.1 Rab5-interacting (Rab5ip) protein [Toxoplasma gondii COUG]|eukprot:XP_002366608.1 hypothetical protein TGME49_239690 [Toxoplasma gondii ME49]
MEGAGVSGVQMRDLASAPSRNAAEGDVTYGDEASSVSDPSATCSPRLAGGRAEKKEAESPPIRPSMVSHNYRQLTVNRHLAAVVAGSVAGIFGLEGLAGLFVFVLVTLLGGCLMLLETRFDCKLYFASTRDIFFAQFFTAALTFILVWTLVYNVVYIF